MISDLKGNRIYCIINIVVKLENRKFVFAQQWRSYIGYWPPGADEKLPSAIIQ